MTIQATIDAMIASGCTPEQIGAVTRVYFAQEGARADRKRAADAARQRAWRAGKGNVAPEPALPGLDVADGDAPANDDERGGVTPCHADNSVTPRDGPSPKKENPRTPIEKTTPSCCSLRSQRFSAREIADFAEEFYEAYPKHVDPKAAKAKFERVVRSGVDPRHIVGAAERFAGAHQRAGTDKQFIAAPAVWLNRGGYDSDDLPQAARAGPDAGASRSNGGDYLAREARQYDEQREFGHVLSRPSFDDHFAGKTIDAVAETVARADQGL